MMVEVKIKVSTWLVMSTALIGALMDIADGIDW